MRKFGFALLGLAAFAFAGSLAKAAMDDEGGDKKFSIHGEVRFRGEWWNNMTDFTKSDISGFPKGSFDDSFDIYPYRVRLAAKGDLGHDVWVYGEFQSAGQAGGGVFGQVQPFFGDDTEVLNSGVHLYQGWVKLKDVGKSVLDITFGRQEIAFDRGLQFSSLDFYNGISHDGVMASWDWENRSIHGFWVRPWESNQVATVLNPNSDADSDILGFHYQQMIGKDHDQDVAGYLFLQLENSSFLDPGQDRGKIYTIGGRWGRMVHGKNGFTWNGELAYQFGDFQPCAAMQNYLTEFVIGPPAACLDNALDQKAYVFEGAFGYVWHSGKTDQKFWGGYTWATGDSDPNDKDQEAYIPLYTDFHSRLGYADLIPLSNIKAIAVGYKVTVDDKHVFGATLYDFTQDATESGTTSPLVSGSLSSSFVGGNALADPCIDNVTGGPGQKCHDKLGNELDIFYNYNMTSNFSFDTALSWFDPGKAVEDHWSGFGAIEAGKDSAYRLTLQARARF